MVLLDIYSKDLNAIAIPAKLVLPSRTRFPL